MNRQLKTKIGNILRRYRRAYHAPVKVPRRMAVKFKIVTIYNGGQQYEGDNT